MYLSTKIRVISYISFTIGLVTSPLVLISIEMIIFLVLSYIIGFWLNIFANKPYLDKCVEFRNDKMKYCYSCGASLREEPLTQICLKCSAELNPRAILET